MKLSEDKINHISHLILDGIKRERLVDILIDEIGVLREIKRIIISELRVDDEIDIIVRKKLASYSKKIIEDSIEWNVLYQKFFKEEYNRKEMGK